MSHRKFLYLARKRRQSGAPLFFPEGYKRRANTTVAGVSGSGEISDQGVVSHTEDWEGRVAATAAPSVIIWKRYPDGTWGPMTRKEMVEKGYIVPGKGPVGVKRPMEGVNEPT